MPTTIGRHEFSNTQVRELFTAQSARDVHLSLWDRFKDLFRSDTKQHQVVAILEKLAAPTGVEGAEQQKLVRFNELIALAKDSERSKFAVVCQPPKAQGNGAQWDLSFEIDGHPIARQTVEESHDLHTFRAASMFSTLHTMREQLRHVPGDADEKDLTDKLENGMKRCLSDTPIMGSDDFRKLHDDVYDEIGKLPASTERGILLKHRLDPLLTSGMDQVTAQTDPARLSPRRLLLQGQPFIVEKRSLAPEPLTTIDTGDDKKMTRVFKNDFERGSLWEEKSTEYLIEGDRTSPDAATRVLGAHQDTLQMYRTRQGDLQELDRKLRLSPSGGVNPPEWEPYSRENLEAFRDHVAADRKTLLGQLEEHALDRVRNLPGNSRDQDRLIKALLSQRTNAAFNEMCKCELTGGSINPGDSLLPQNRRSDDSKPDQLKMLLSCAPPGAPSVIKVKLTDTSHPTQVTCGNSEVIKLHSESVIKIEVEAEIRAGKLVPVNAFFSAHLVPEPLAAESAADAAAPVRP